MNKLIFSNSFKYKDSGWFCLCAETQEVYHKNNSIADTNEQLRARSKSSKSSKELIELLIDDRSSDGESSSDESSIRYFLGKQHSIKQCIS